MPAIVECDCIPELAIPQKLDQIFCQGASANVILEAILEALGGGITTDQYVSLPVLAVADGTIPVGVLGWSITAVSGTVTVNGSALAIGQTVRGGGYGGRTLKTAIAYTITAGSALVTTDTPG